MKEWYSALELTGLPGMPGTKRAIQIRAKRSEWQSRKRKARGGGYEYHISSLPQETRDALVAKVISKSPATSKDLPATMPTDAISELPGRDLHDTTQLKKWQRDTMEARLSILREIEQLEKVVSVNKAVDKFLELAKQGQIPPHLAALITVANGRSGNGNSNGNGRCTLSRRTILRWRSLAAQGHAALAPADVERYKIPVWGPALMKAWKKPQKVTLTDAVREVQCQGYDITYHAARRFMDRLGEVEKLKGRMGARELKNVKPFRRRDTSKLWPGDVYTADGHTFDAEIAHPDHGQAFRPEVTLILDVATRKATGWGTSLSESAYSVLDAFRNAVETNGVPAIFYTDNGGGYCNEVLTAEGTGLMGRVGTTHKTSLPYNSQARGLSERGHQTILVRAAKRLPTYMGKDMDPEAKQIVFKKTRKDPTLLPPWKWFVNYIDQVVHEYNDRSHRGLPKVLDSVTGRKRHITPNEAWQLALSDGWEPTEAGEIADLYKPQIIRSVIRGEVALFNNRYYSKYLAEWHGERVMVGYDIHDPSRVWVRDTNHRLICVAELDANVSDYFPLSVIDQAKDKRGRQRMKRLELKMEEVELERQAIQSKVVDITPEQEAKAAKALARGEKKRLPATDYEKLEMLEEMKKNGEDIAPEDEQWMKDYLIKLFPDEDFQHG